MVTLELMDPVYGALTLAATILVPLDDSWRDLDGDGCNGLSDLQVAASLWRTATSTDADGSGIVDVLDLLYINTGGSCP